MKANFACVSCKPKVSGFFQYTLISFVTLCIATFGLNAQPLLLRDINTRGNVEQNEFRSLTPGHGTLYFVNNFNELWKTTGNAGGTIRLKAFHSIGNFKHIGQTLYFAADDGSGMELWKCTGTYASIEKVKEIVPGNSGCDPAFITDANGIFYFTATTADRGNELWRSDGTSAGTSLVKDIQPGKRGSDPKGLTFINGTLYFSANDGKTGHELWKTDGTSAGTVLVKDIREGQYLGSTPEQLTNVNGTLFFVAYEPAAGKELWKSDGSTGGTMLAADIRAGAGSPDVRNLTAVNNTLFFSANDGIHGHELWKSEGVHVTLVKDLTAGAKGSHGQQVFTHPMTNFTSVLGSLFFTAYQNDIYYIWKSDGTAAGTVPIEIARNGINTAAPRFVPMGSSIFYFNSPDDIDNIYETHLMKIRADGTGPVLIARLFQEDFYTRYEPELATMNNSLYFWGRRDGEGFALFRSNGTPGSMILLNDSFRPTQSSHPSNMTRTENGQVFFVAEEDTYASSIWRTDGTPEGTRKIRDLGSWGTPEIVTTETHAYFAGLDGFSIWKSDGTPEGTVQLVSDPSRLLARHLRVAGDMIYFAEVYGGLWRSDGTEAGTFNLKEAADVRFVQPVGDMLYFMIEIDNNHFELWGTDGDPSGTYRIFTFSGNRTSYHNPTTVDGNIMYFIADDGVYGNEVWRTDGTNAGTFRLADLNAGDNNLFGGVFEVDIAHFEMWRGDLYISALDNTNTWALYKYNASGMTRIRDLNMASDMIPTADRLHIFSRISNEVYASSQQWVTDGTSTGTELINDQHYYGSVNHIIYDEILYFNAYDMFLWRSDGTSCGTFPVDPGINVSNGFQNIGNLLVFGGISPVYGIEPYVIDLNDAPESPCGEPPFRTSSSIVADNNDLPDFTSYPNPFTQEFLVTIPGSPSDIIEMQIFTPSGLPLETLRNIAANTEYRLGGSWKPGQYLVKINKSGQILTRQVLKK